MSGEENITVRIKVDEEKWKVIKRMAVERGESVQEFAGDLIEIGSSELSDEIEGILEIEKPSTKEIIKIEYLEDYEKALKIINPKVRYTWKEEGKTINSKSRDLLSDEEEELKTTYEAFLHQGALHCFYILGKFPSLKMYQKAMNEGFDGYDTVLYNIIKEGGFKTHSDYKKARGECDEYDFIKILDLGYSNYEDYTKDAGDLSLNEWAVCSKSGFKDYKEVREAEEMGYLERSRWGPRTGSDDIEDFRNAKKGGFKEFREYQRGNEKGFSKSKEWEEFKKTDFGNREEFLKGKELGTKDPEIVKVYLFLANFPPGRAIAVNKIADAADVYEEDLDKIFKKAPIKKLGKYDAKGSTFIRNKKATYSYKCVIIDGANVATDTEEIDGKEVKKAYIKKLEVAMKKAEEMGMPVYVYVTAYLKNRIDDKAKLKSYIQKKKVIETTGKSEDDKFFIQAALEKDGFIITNDFLRQYKEAHPDKADEIENRRVPFNFHDEDTVYFGGKLSEIKNGDEISDI